MSLEYRKDMHACSGAVPTISQRIFEQCGNDVSPDSPELLPLCNKHLEVVSKEITHALREQVAELQADIKKSRDEVAAELTNEWAANREAVQRRTAEARYKRSRVYFLRCGEFIKIGTTTNLTNRLAAIQKSGGVLMPEGLDYRRTELVAAIHGERHQEQELHTRFAHLRHTGEWFTEAPELTDYITSLQEIPA